MSWKFQRALLECSFGNRGGKDEHWINHFDCTWKGVSRTAGYSNPDLFPIICVLWVHQLSNTLCAPLKHWNHTACSVSYRAKKTTTLLHLPQQQFADWVIPAALQIQFKLHCTQVDWLCVPKHLVQQLYVWKAGHIKSWLNKRISSAENNIVFWKVKCICNFF